MGLFPFFPCCTSEVRVRRAQPWSPAPAVTPGGESWWHLARGWETHLEKAPCSLGVLPTPKVMGWHSQAGSPRDAPVPKCSQPLIDGELGKIRSNITIKA